MNILPFEKKYRFQAAALFLSNFKILQQTVPLVPNSLGTIEVVADQIAEWIDQYNGLAAVEGDQLVGYVLWLTADQFRNTDRRGSYTPEWGHAAVRGKKARVYRDLYAYVSSELYEAGCDSHALTYLATDRDVQDFLYWNGFGMTVVDAVRSMEAVPEKKNPFIIRKAGADDIPALVEIEAEHWRHYSQAPVLMEANSADDAEEFARLLDHPGFSAWMAETSDGKIISYQRFETQSSSVDILQSEQTVNITGAYTLPEFRGLGAAAALLNEGLRFYREQGYQICAVDFESINPHASGFWMRYFEPVCYSAIRVPERRKENRS